MASPSESNSQASRRQFMQAGAAGVAAAAFTSSNMVHAAGTETIKVGLIGCGGRGSGAAANAMKADENVQLTAMADLFKDSLDRSRNTLRSRLGAKYAVTDDNCFVGFDAYKKLMATDVDVVLLATPPHFRPAHLAAAVEAGKHIFCEKPVAVDAPGCRSVYETTEKAREKGLSLVSGLCWRYDLAVLETMKRIQDGAIGDIVTIQPNYLTGTLWHRGRQPNWSEMEYQCRNWLYFNWLSGDHIVEQHIHSLDKALWLNDNKPPARAFGLGGRQMRTGEKWGNIFDHHAVCYEWDSGVKAFAYTRQMDRCYNDVDDHVYGTKGTARMLRFSLKNEQGSWRYPNIRTRPSMYDLEHVALFKSIRSGEPINNGQYMTNSTMMAIMGRMACYTGQNVAWQRALDSKEDLSPEKYEFGDLKMRPVARPGFSELG